MDNEEDKIYHEDPEYVFLTSYQQDRDHDWEKRRQRAKAQVNFLAICVLKEYRKKLQSNGVPRKPFTHDIKSIQTMPLEIIFEILEYLHPIDLLHLTKIHTTFQGLLKTCSSNSVWKAAFANFSDIPKIPPDVTGYRWANLLFNPSICENCGASPAPPNVTFYQRLCVGCHRKEFMSIVEFLEMNDDDDGGSRVRSLSRQTHFIMVDPSNETGLEQLDDLPPTLNITEVDDIMSTSLKLQRAIETGAPDAEQSLERYDAERHELVKASIARHDECLKWAGFYQRALFRKANSTVSSLLVDIKFRFKSLGFEQDDVNSAVFSTKILTDLVNITGISRLTRRRWAKLRPLLEPAVAAATKERLELERKKLISQRTEFIKEGYITYSKSCLPATWAYLPPFYAVKQFDFVAKLIDSPHDDPLVEADLVELLKLLPQEIDDWTASKMKQLISFLPGYLSDESAENPTSPQTDINLLSSPLVLATSVFHCHGSVKNGLRMGGCLIGWDGAGPHLRCRALEHYWEKRLHFSQRGHDTATLLVQLVGLDPATTKIWEMDKLDKRFVCLICPTESREVYSWQDAVYHYMSTEGDDIHDTLSWGLLGPEAEADIKSREEPDPYIWENNWVCNHCPEHFEKRVPRAAVIDHAREIHDISRPINNLDYLYFVTDRTYRSFLHLPEVGPREFACLRCASTKCRLYRWRTLKAHLKDAHGLSAPVESEDWKKIDIFLRSSPESTSSEQNKFK